jgi:hypothetical protein
MLIDEVDAVVRAFLLTDEAGTTTYTPESDDLDDLGGVEVVPGFLYRYPQADPAPVMLQVFLGVGEIGARLWEQEVKVLMRVASIQHPALPEMLNGGDIEAKAIAEKLGGSLQNIAYVRTRSDLLVGPEDIDAVAQGMHDDPVHALRQLWLLADALSILHDARISHRNLWPGTLQAFHQERDPDGRWSFRLGRFEMSALLSNVLRATSVDASGRKVVRQLYLAQGPLALRYAPPERLRFMFEEEAGLPAGAEGDVFGLGMTVAEWFLASLPDSPHLDGPESVTLPALLAFHEQVRTAVRTHPGLPSALSALLNDMLDRNPSGRPTTAEVMARLSENYDGIVSLLEGQAESVPPLLLYLPRTRANLIAWGWLDDPTETDTRKIAAVIEADLRGSVVVESGEGAVPFLTRADGPAPDTLKQARWVLVGKRAAWFCRPYELRARPGRGPELLTDVFLITHIALRDRSRIDRLLEAPLKRQIGSVQVESDQLTQRKLADLRQDRPDWAQLFGTVEAPIELHPREVKFGQAIDFLLEYQGALLTARTYPFFRDPAGSEYATEVVLHWDRERDRARKDHLPPLHAKLFGDDALRPAFAHFFEEAAQGSETAGSSYLRMITEVDGRTIDVDDFQLVGSTGEDSIRVRSVNGKPVPAAGMLRPTDDGGTRAALRRQADARGELVRNRILVNRLVDPTGIRGPRDRWEGAVGRLEGEGAEVVIDMLRYQPMFALQGPPGTGKTEISSQAVQAQLRLDPSERILVSAQSHYALDNLAVRILTKLGLLDEHGEPQDSDVIAIRLFNDRSIDRVDQRLHAFGRAEAAGNHSKWIKQRVQSRLNALVDPPKLRQIAESWRDEIKHSTMELSQRLRRAANLVFVTCAAATREELLDNGSREPFDWVIIEEAAKAWPTELAIPLVRGLRWALIGDHKQIGAFGRVEVDRFLNSCYKDPEPEVAKHFDRRKDYLEAFDLFGMLIENATDSGPVRKLTEQRRMHDPISQVVSRSFYSVKPAEPEDEHKPGAAFVLPEGLLKTMRVDDGHELQIPHWLRGVNLVWLDTTGRHDEQGYWSNAYEAQVVSAFVHGLHPSAVPSGDREKNRLGLAVLTPYRRQVDVIRSADQRLRDAVKTVDAFQGREADIVVVSLVRDIARTSWDRPLTNLGHLADPNRVNVMLSRARDLLVLVGSFEHFAGSRVRTWTSVTTAVEKFGVRRPAASVLGK